jgi:hypothetical protein
MELTIEQQSFDIIKLLYPNEWILVGNPQMDTPLLQTSIRNKLKSGIVLYHSKDRREIGYKAKEVRQGYKSVTLVYTGDIPKNRKWLL